MLDQKVIQDKLANEGIPEELSKGINFEAEEDLNGWVNSFKTTVKTTKAIGDYTKDELKTLADTGENVNLQSLLDEVRTSAIKKAKEKVTPPNDTKVDTGVPKNTAEELKALFQKEIDELKATQLAGLERQKTELLEINKSAYIDKNTEGFGSYDVNILKKMIPATATEAEIDAKIAEMRQARLAQGLSSYKSYDGNPDKKGDIGDVWGQAIKATIDKKKSKNKNKK